MIITFHNYMLDPFMQQYSSFLQQIHYPDLNTLLNKLAQEPVLKPNKLKIGQIKINKLDIQ